MMSHLNLKNIRPHRKTLGAAVGSMTAGMLNESLLWVKFPGKSNGSARGKMLFFLRMSKPRVMMINPMRIFFSVPPFN
jgi:cellulase/cellobiase CelA1